jgi:hypothetical protein
MDYQEEQAQELEVLTSIYDEEEFERILIPALSDGTEISPTEYWIRVIPDIDKPDPRTLLRGY